MATLNLQEMTGYGMPSMPSMPTVGIQSLQSPSLMQVDQVQQSPLGLTPYQSPYSSRTIDRSGLTYSNGKVLYEGKEVSPFDRIKETYHDMDGNPQEMSRSLYDYSTVADLFGEDQGTPYTIYDGGLRWSSPANYGSVKNPYVKPADYDPFLQFVSDPLRRSALYGNYIQSSVGGFNDDDKGPDITKYAGEEYSQSGGRGNRGQSTDDNANYVLNTLSYMFPTVKPEDLDRAAWAAMQDTSGQPWRGGRAGQAWYYAGNLNDYVRQIASKLPGGLPDNFAQKLKETDAKMSSRGANIRKAAHAQDDADSGMGPLGSLLGMAAGFALGPAGFAALPAWGAGAVGGGLGGLLSSGGDIGAGIKGAFSGGIGAGLGGEIAGAIGENAGFNFMGNDFVGPLSMGEGFAKSALSGATSGLLKGVVSGGNPWESALQGGFMGGAGNFASGLDPTGIPNIDTAIERGLVNAGGAGLFGGDVTSSLLGTAANLGSVGFGDYSGMSDSATKGLSSLAQQILKSSMTQKQKQDALNKLKQRQQAGLMSRRAA